MIELEKEKEILNEKLNELTEVAREPKNLSNLARQLNDCLSSNIDISESVCGYSSNVVASNVVASNDELKAEEQNSLHELKALLESALMKAEYLHGRISSIAEKIG